MPRPATHAEVIAEIGALPRERTRFVGVDGFGGSGKTTLVDAVAAAVPGVAVVRLDDLQGEGIDAWDWSALDRDVVAPLLAGRPARYALRSWGEREPRGYVDIAVGSLVVVEGVSALRCEAVVPWDLTVWVAAPESVRRRRTLERDGAASQAVWNEHWIPSEQAYAARDRPHARADLVVNGGPRPDDPDAVAGRGNGSGRDLGQWRAP